MNQVANTQQPAPLVQFKRDLQRSIDAGEFALPSTVDPNAFRNAAIIAFQGDGGIYQCTPESIFKALRVLAGAGLMPDGREAAIVKYGTTATAMPMVAGLIKVARNSGKVTALWADVVYEGETLDTWIEDGEPRFSHSTADGKRIDAMDRGGEVRGAFAVAKMKDGTIDFQPMSKSEIEKRRRASATQKGEKPTGIWAQWYEEMAKKTVIRNLAKRLPMSTEDIDRIMKEQEPPELRDVTPEREDRPNLAQQIASGPEEPHDAVTGEVLDAEPAQDADLDESKVDPFSDEYTEGVKAHSAGMKEKMNPHEPGSEQWNNWLGGFRFALDNVKGDGQ